MEKRAFVQDGTIWFLLGLYTDKNKHTHCFQMEMQG